MTRTIIQIGNSEGLTLPKEIREEAGFRKGVKVDVSLSNDGGIVINKVENKVAKIPSDKEFKKWWDTFIKENAEILDELAVR